MGPSNQDTEDKDVVSDWGGREEHLSLDSLISQKPTEGKKPGL